MKWWKPEPGNEITGHFVNFCHSASGLGVTIVDDSGEEVQVGAGVGLRAKFAACHKDLKPLLSTVRIRFEGKQQVKSDAAKTVAIYHLWVNDEEIFAPSDFGRPLAASEVEDLFALKPDEAAQ